MSDAMTRSATLLQAIAAGIDKVLKEHAGQRMGFSLILWPRTGDERCNYVSNCERPEVAAALEQLLSDWKASPVEIPGSHRVN